MAKHTLKIFRREHHKIFVVCLAIFFRNVKGYGLQAKVNSIDWFLYDGKFDLS